MTKSEQVGCAHLELLKKQSERELHYPRELKIKHPNLGQMIQLTMDCGPIANQATKEAPTRVQIAVWAW